MKTTYTGTMFHRDLREAKVDVQIFEGSKYSDEDYVEKIQYTGLTSWDIITDEDAEELEAGMGELIDENHEYLVLHFEDGKTATFRNSHVAMYIW